MSVLLDHIRALIEKTGPLSIARYMELALQHPEQGYYRHGDPVGRSGDFVTAPEVSQMFGELLGLALAEAWKAMGKPPHFTLLELGPGHGTLMQDALRATAKIGGFQTAMQLYLLESNETLRKIQREKLGAYDPVFIDAIDEFFTAPPDEPLFVIANEFFDALPVRQFEKTEKGWCERLVGMDGDELEFILSPPDPAFLFLISADRREAANGTMYEVSLPALSLVRQIARHVMKHGGVGIIVDYGYAVPPGKATFQAVSGHRHADVLERPGEVDLTTHVDFAALKLMAQEQGAVVSGPVGQGEYLQTLGIEMRATLLKHNAGSEQVKIIDAAVRRLTDTGEMGVLFKVLAVNGPLLGPLPGF